MRKLRNLANFSPRGVGQHSSNVVRIPQRLGILLLANIPLSVAVLGAERTRPFCSQKSNAKGSYTKLASNKVGDNLI